MAIKQDIYVASGIAATDTIYNGSLAVNPGGTALKNVGCGRDFTTSYANINLPIYADISGKYDVRFSG